jgi:hypothetical protein
MAAAAIAAHPELFLLELAVPLWIEQMRGYSVSERLAAARTAGQFVAEHGDALMFRERHSAEAFNQLARGLAAAAYQPGGVTFATMHWHADDGGRDEAAPPRRPVRNVAVTGDAL